MMNWILKKIKFCNKGKDKNKNIDDENLSLWSLANTKGIGLANSRAKNLNGIFTNINKSESYNTDNENRPLRSNGNLKDIEKHAIRFHADSRAQGDDQ